VVVARAKYTPKILQIFSVALRVYSDSSQNRGLLFRLRLIKTLAFLDGSSDFCSLGRLTKITCGASSRRRKQRNLLPWTRMQKPPEGGFVCGSTPTRSRLWIVFAFLINYLMRPTRVVLAQRVPKTTFRVVVNTRRIYSKNYSNFLRYSAGLLRLERRTAVLETAVLPLNYRP